LQHEDGTVEPFPQLLGIDAKWGVKPLFSGPRVRSGASIAAIEMVETGEIIRGEDLERNGVSYKIAVPSK